MNRTHLSQFCPSPKVGGLLASIGMLSATLLFGSPAFAVTGTPQVAWTISMADPTTSTLSSFSCRYITRASIGGNGVRVQLSNFYGSTPLTINSITVATRISGAAASGHTAVTFGGQTAVTIPPRSKIMSDPIDYTVNAQDDLAISLYYPGTTPVLTKNSAGRTNSYCTTTNAGDATYDFYGIPYTTTTGTVHTVDAVDVYQTQPHGAVVALGASITQGWLSTIDANKRWTDVLSSNFLASSNPKSVVNEGIAGTTSCDAAARFNRDGLALSNVSEVILGGVGGNDVQNGASAASIQACMQNMIDQAHAAGIRIIGGTIPPRSFTSTLESVRVQANNWMKANGGFDGLVDFDAVLRDPNNPTQLNPSYKTSVDNTHPNDAGSAAMGNAVSLSLFTNGGNATPTWVGPGTYDDQDYFAFSYAGPSPGENNANTWQHDANCGVTNCYQNTRSWSNNLNDNVTVRFYGTQIKLYGIKKSNFGIGAVSIDGGTETNVDFYSASSVRDLLWTSPVLANGPHTFKLRTTLTKNPGNTSSFYIIEPDSVDIIGSGTTTYDDMNYSAFQYVGTGWSHDATCQPTATPNCYNSSKSWSSTTNDYVTVTFQGSQIQLYGSKYTTFGIGAVSIDGGIETNLDFYAPTRMGNQLMWTSPKLPSGTHTLKLRVTGTRGNGSSTTVEPDAVLVSP